MSGLAREPNDPTCNQDKPGILNRKEVVDLDDLQEICILAQEPSSSASVVQQSCGYWNNAVGG